MGNKITIQDIAGFPNELAIVIKIWETSFQIGGTSVLGGAPFLSTVDGLRS